MVRKFNTTLNIVFKKLNIVMSSWVTRTMLLLLGLWSFPPQPNAYFHSKVK